MSNYPAYLNQQQTRPSRRSQAPSCNQSRERCVLVVEFRDEVYARLKADLEQDGVTVRRAVVGAVVAACVNRFLPDLILISDQLPDESCLLVAAKLRIGRHDGPVWIYAANGSIQRPACLAVAGIDKAINCGRDLCQSSDRICQDVRSFFSEHIHSYPLPKEEQVACRSNQSAACQRSLFCLLSHLPDVAVRSHQRQCPLPTDLHPIHRPTRGRYPTVQHRKRRHRPMRFLTVPILTLRHHIRRLDIHRQPMEIRIQPQWIMPFRMIRICQNHHRQVVRPAAVLTNRNYSSLEPAECI